jgi:translation initiation factor 2B subunit (eIF-2B alpha/beta/delta family)
VNVWEGEPEVARREAAAYVERWGIEGTVLLDDTGAYARRVGVRGVPTNVYVDDGGLVRAVGATTAEAMLEQAARLEPRLAGGGSPRGARSAPAPLPRDFA